MVNSSAGGDSSKIEAPPSLPRVWWINMDQSISLFMIRFNLNYLCLDNVKVRSARHKGYIYLATFVAILGIIIVLISMAQVTKCTMLIFFLFL